MYTVLPVSASKPVIVANRLHISIDKLFLESVDRSECKVSWPFRGYLYGAVTLCGRIISRHLKKSFILEFGDIS